MNLAGWMVLNAYGVVMAVLWQRYADWVREGT